MTTLFSRLYKIIGLVLELFIAAISVFWLYVNMVGVAIPPEVDFHPINLEPVLVSENYFELGKNYLRKNEFGVWEMYVEGDPYERGIIYGALAKELIQKQEDVFVGQIHKYVPNDFWLYFLKLFVGFFNQDIPNNISMELQEELYGVSTFFSDAHDNIAPKYTRILNYHAAHDIGHALNNYSLVGCSSFVLNNEVTADRGLLVGRNFDFYVNDEFSQEKLILFMRPTQGNAFVSYSWAGMMGVVSGMNEMGLTVTLNAAKSDLPSRAATPVSLLAREILQYASSIDEAIKIANSREVFVSESILVVSASESKAVIIEKSPGKMGQFSMKGDRLICTNHYQSEVFAADSINVQNIRNSDSFGRFRRLTSLLSEKSNYTAADAAIVLRDVSSNEGDSLGLGNPLAINQLICHHSIIFKPEILECFVSTYDYQLGPYIKYNLHDVFELGNFSGQLSIHEDPMIHSDAYQSYKNYHRCRKLIQGYLDNDYELNLLQDEITNFIASNSECYTTYLYAGLYFKKSGNLSLARENFELAMKLKLPSKEVEFEISELIRTCEK